MGKVLWMLGRALLWGCLLMALPASAERPALALSEAPVLRHYGVADGVPQVTVNGLLRTQDGFLWVSTFGGLARFDGQTFRVLRSDEGGPVSRRITALHEDALHQLWVGTEDAGLGVYREGTFRTLNICEKRCIVFRLFSPNAREVWAMTAKGVFRIDAKTFRTIGSIPINGQYSLSARVAGQTLLGGLSGLQQWDNGALKSLALPDGRRRVHAMVAQEGIVWMLLDGAFLYRYTASNRQWEAIKTLQEREIHLLEDGAGRVYLADARNGTRRLLNDGREETVPGAEKLYAISLLVDSEETLWIGTPNDGLWAVRPARVGVLRSAVEPAAPGRVLAADGRGGIWLAMSCISLWHLDAAGTQTEWPVAAALGDGCIHSLLYEKESNALWIGTSGGVLARLQQGRVERVAVWPQAGQVGVWKEGSAYWVANAQFVGRMHLAADGSVQRIEKIPALAGMEVKRITAARTGGVWVAGDRGAFRIDGGNIAQRWTPAQHKGLRFLRALYEDTAGVLWLGSYGNGLFRIEHGDVQQFTEANGLVDDTVSCILPDDRGPLWLAGNRGINVLMDRHIGAAGPVMRSLTEKDGLITSEFNGSTVPPCVDDGRSHLWFAMMTGFARVSPMQLDWSRGRVPTAYIEQASAAGPLLHLSGRNELSANTNMLSVRYGAIFLLGLDQVRFRYRIVGAMERSNDWVNAGINRSVLLSELPWGHFTFEVQARELGGAWSPSAQLQLYRPQPWYKHQWAWWALSLACLVALLLMRAHEDDADAELLSRLRKPESGQGH